MPPKRAAAASISVRSDALKGRSVIITGDVEGQTRKSAEQILIKAGAKIEKSMNKKVQLVVLGQDAGGAKLNKAEELGIATQEWDNLIAEIKDNVAMDAGEDGWDDADVEDGALENAKEEEQKPVARKRKANTKAAPAPESILTNKVVIITGTVPGHDRKSAQAVVEKAGAIVAKSLNKQVEIAILGTNAGPDKLKTIQSYGIETINWEEIADKLGIEIPPQKEVADIDVGDAPDSVDGKVVIITGTVQGETRASAQKLLEKAGATYAKSLNQSVELIILGTQPGPEKVNEIAERGLRTCTWDALVKKLGLGQAKKPQTSPPKKRQRRS